MVTESVVMQLVGYGVFTAEEWEERAYRQALHQPLVIAMVAGLYVVNFTSSRAPFLRILHDSSEPVYIAHC